MAGQVLKKRSLVNAGRRRRMTDKQIRFFGTPRQKAALRNRRHNAGQFSRRKTKKRLKSWTRKMQSRGISIPRSFASETVKRYAKRSNEGFISESEHAAAHAIRSVERAAEDAIETLTGAGAMNPGRRKNVGEILTVIPAANRGRRRSMAARAHNRRRVHNRRHNRGRRHNAHRRRHNRRSGMNPRVVVRYRNRRHNRRHARRRNQPAFTTGPVGVVVGILGGGAITKILANFVPSALMQGNPVMSGVITAGIGIAQGQLLGKLLKNPRFGLFLTAGGVLMGALELAAAWFPALALPFSITGGTSGMGLLTSSNFYVPQVNVPGSMATFVAPAALPAPVVATAGAKMSGLGYAYPGLRTVRRTGRLR